MRASMMKWLSDWPIENDIATVYLLFLKQKCQTVSAELASQTIYFDKTTLCIMIVVDDTYSFEFG